MENSVFHNPVMPGEVIDFLHPEAKYKIVDATVGCGGHARLILEKILPHGLLVGIDADQTSLEVAHIALKQYEKNVVLVCANFRDIGKVLDNAGLDRIDGALFDLGVSSYQIANESRGFSFMREGLLDMRMDLAGGLRAYDIVNKYRREDLEEIIRDFGQERYFRRIAGAIVEKRKRLPIRSTTELAAVIRGAVGRKYASQKIQPATRTFQAIRIAVNNELDNISQGITKAVDFLANGRRLCVISFHSLEDRIVKNKFKEFQKASMGRIVTKKPVRATKSEVDHNPRSRSAKLRVFEKGRD